jgi:hypothetical protein
MTQKEISLVYHNFNQYLLSTCYKQELFKVFGGGGEQRLCFHETYIFGKGVTNLIRKLIKKR